MLRGAAGRVYRVCRQETALPEAGEAWKLTLEMSPETGRRPEVLRSVYSHASVARADGRPPHHRTRSGAILEVTRTPTARPLAQAGHSSSSGKGGPRGSPRYTHCVIWAWCVTIAAREARRCPSIPSRPRARYLFQTCSLLLAQQTTRRHTFVFML